MFDPAPPALEASAIDHRVGVEIARHAHDRGQLSLVLRGTMMVTSEDGWWLIPPGLAFWVPPDVAHGARYSESSSLLHLRFDARFVASVPRHCDSIVMTDLLRELAHEAVRIDGQTAQADTLALIAQLVVQQIRQPKPGPGLFVPHGRDRRLQHAVAELRRHPGDDITLDALAARAHTSSRTLARLFVTETGMTFGRWREHLRVVCAVDRLARGQSITQTALELGYRSTSSFTTLFTRLLGMPPRKYMLRLMAREKQA
ncbi:AraC family transcriptional regulator [Burkholderia sp. WAC0059]|uniref:AraC family transcriptional regulator n=1 Tax=Burkholderia sp. WAC0059 TaxID=2066022 RepID=UPI000C7F35B7|nr:helix-turn-helix transcriptional regulator [Burkholderia sp. WAC0059]PLZ00467.1 AraC family transcriptional regulator [Burkholderia sp. WAC0059]